MLFRQWELSLEGLTKAWSGLESTVKWVMELGTTGHMCQSKQFVPACLLLCQPFSPETCHSSLYNQSFPLYNQLCSHSIIRMFWHLLDKAYLLRVHACKFRWPEAVCMPHYMNGDMSVSWQWNTCFWAKWQVPKIRHCSCDFAHTCKQMWMIAGICSLITEWVHICLRDGNEP